MAAICAALAMPSERPLKFWLPWLCMLRSPSGRTLNSIALVPQILEQSLRGSTACSRAAQHSHWRHQSQHQLQPRRGARHRQGPRRSTYHASLRQRQGQRDQLADRGGSGLVRRCHHPKAIAAGAGAGAAGAGAAGAGAGTARAGAAVAGAGAAGAAAAGAGNARAEANCRSDAAGAGIGGIPFCPAGAGPAAGTGSGSAQALATSCIRCHQVQQKGGLKQPCSRRRRLPAPSRTRQHLLQLEPRWPCQHLRAPAAA